MGEWLQGQGVFLGIIITWLIGFYLVVISLAALFKTFWQTRWSDRRKAATIAATLLAVIPALLIGWQYQWSVLIAFALGLLVTWKYADDEKRYRDDL